MRLLLGFILIDSPVAGSILVWQLDQPIPFWIANLSAALKCIQVSQSIFIDYSGLRVLTLQGKGKVIAATVWLGYGLAGCTLCGLSYHLKIDYLGFVAWYLLCVILVTLGPIVTRCILARVPFLATLCLKLLFFFRPCSCKRRKKPELHSGWLRRQTNAVNAMLKRENEKAKKLGKKQKPYLKIAPHLSKVVARPKFNFSSSQPGPEFECDVA